MIPQRTPIAPTMPTTPVPADLAQLLVVCPTCSTTFCVESSAVAAMESPHFHCSRCDAVFSLTAARAHQRALEQRTTLSPAHSHRTATNSPRYEDTHVESGESVCIDAGDYDLSASDQSQGEFRDGPAGVRTAAPDSSPPLVHRNTPHATLNAITEPRPRSTGSAHRLRSFSNGIKASEFSLGSTAKPPQARPTPPPAHHTAPAPALRAAPTLHPEPPPAARGDLLAPHNDADVDLPESALLSCSDLGYTAVTVNTPLHPFNTDTDTPDAPGSSADFTSAEHPDALRRTTRSSLWARCAPRTRGLLCMSAPLVTTFAALIALSYSSRMSPLTIGATMRAVAPGFLSKTTPQLPPAEVNVRAVRLHFTKVATKETVAFITGTVVNSTDTTLGSVTLEGIGFNERGEVVISAQAPLRSALSREKPATLSFENIQKFQGSLSARSAGIGPHEEVPFTIALIPQHPLNSSDHTTTAASEVDVNQLRYFSARVFSVR